MSNKDNQKSESVDRSASTGKETLSARPVKQPTKSKLDSYTPPARKKSD